jgi:hypothetical protein
MNKLTNKLFTSVGNLAETPGVIANAADKLLRYILPKDDAAAACWTYKCDGCGRERPRQRKCRRCCAGYPCYDVWKNC